MTFNPNIPQSGDRPSQTQGQILTNFQQLNTVFDVNHVPFNDPTVANRGKHKVVTVQRQGAAPAITGSDAAFYTRSPGISPTAGPFFKNVAVEYSMALAINAGNFSLSSSSGTKNVINMTQYPPMAGTVIATDISSRDRTIFSPFYWNGTALSVPGVNGQLPSGSFLVRFDDDSDGIWLQIEKTSGSVTVDIRFFVVLI